MLKPAKGKSPVNRAQGACRCLCCRSARCRGCVWHRNGDLVTAMLPTRSVLNAGAGPASQRQQPSVLMCCALHADVEAGSWRVHEAAVAHGIVLTAGLEGSNQIDTPQATATNACAVCQRMRELTCWKYGTAARTWTACATNHALDAQNYSPSVCCAAKTFELICGKRSADAAQIALKRTVSHPREQAANIKVSDGAFLVDSIAFWPAQALCTQCAQAFCQIQGGLNEKVTLVIQSAEGWRNSICNAPDVFARVQRHVGARHPQR